MVESGTDQLAAEPLAQKREASPGRERVARGGQRLGRGQAHGLLRRFAVHGVLWRNYLDWAVENVPFYLQPVLIGLWTAFFYFFAGPARRAVVQNLRVILPGSSRALNHARAFLVLFRYAQTIADGASFRVNRAEFDYEIEGAEHLEALSRARGAIVLTAHMGNYDLGAALFARKFARALFMVRAPERDAAAGEHLSASVQATGGGAVKIAYKTDDSHVAFDLLNALRRGEIVSIQGDRAIPGVASIPTQLHGARLLVPGGPFSLAQVTQAPIYPLFILRAGHQRYRVIVRAPLQVARDATREESVRAAAQTWADVLQAVVSRHWDDWFAFTPLFTAHD